jgi:hypothetical protein
VAILVILVLVVLWAAVLVPPILRSRNAVGIGGVSDFMDSLRSLGGRHNARNDFGGTLLHGPVGGGSPGRGARNPIAPPLAYRPMPGGVSPMQRRRRNVLTTLGGAVGVTFFLALVARSMAFYLLFVLAAAALGGYCYLLVQIKHRAVVARGVTPRQAVVSSIDIEEEAPRTGDNVIVLRRHAAG